MKKIFKIILISVILIVLFFFALGMYQEYLKTKNGVYGQMLSSHLLSKNATSTDGWEPAVGSGLIPPAQVQVKLHEEMVEAIELSTNGIGTSAMVAREVSIPKDTAFLSFCYVFPKEDDHWITLHFAKTGADPKEPYLMWSMAAFAENGYDNFRSKTGKVFMNKALIPISGLEGSKGTFYLTLHNKGSKSTKAIFTEFQLLSNDAADTATKRQALDQYSKLHISEGDCFVSDKL